MSLDIWYAMEEKKINEFGKRWIHTFFCWSGLYKIKGVSFVISQLNQTLVGRVTANTIASANKVLSNTLRLIQIRHWINLF